MQSSKPRRNRLWSLLRQSTLRYAGWLVLGSVALSVPATYYSAKLFGNLRPDLEELLPKKARSVTDVGEIRRRLQSIDNLAVLVFSEDTRASKRFIEDLAANLQKLPTSVVASVEYKIADELAFFSSRKALFVEVPDLERIRNYVRDRIDYEKALYNPLTFLSNADFPEPHLDIQSMLGKYEGKASSFSRFPQGYYATPDEKKRVILVDLPATGSGIEGIHRLKKAVEETIAALKPESYAPDLKILYTGGVQNTIEEHSALINDIERSAEVVFTLVTLALILFFRSFLATAALFFSLFMARFWTFGATYFLVGYLNANSAFMGSIVLGSGITFGVILLSRYLEERRNHRKPSRSAWIAITRTARATWTAALASGVAYGSLFLTDFEGFRQYGIIGLVGMMFCWVSSILVFPATLIVLERFRPLVKAHAPKRKPWLFGPLTQALGKYPEWFLGVSVVITVISLLSFVKFDRNTVIETNLANLRNKESMTKGSGYLSKYIDEIFQRYLSPVVVLARTQPEAFAIAKKLQAKKDLDGEHSLFANVSTIQQFVPGDQKRKQAVLQDIRELLPAQLYSQLDESDKKRVSGFLTREAFQPLAQEQLPKLILRKFTEKDGSIGKLVLVEPPLTSAQWSGAQLNQFVDDVREISDETAGVSVPIAGGLPITSDMFKAISRDGPKATLFAFLAVVALVILIFRKPIICSYIIVALVIGNFWLFGFILLFDVKINFLNFIALPITFGIGVDYAVNIFHRYVEDPAGDIVKVIRETGAAVGICSLTTNIGYSSLLIAGNQAFVSFGTLAVFGEVTTLLAALFTVPAYILVRQKYAARAT